MDDQKVGRGGMLQALDLNMDLHLLSLHLPLLSPMPLVDFVSVLGHPQQDKLPLSLGQ